MRAGRPCRGPANGIAGGSWNPGGRPEGRHPAAAGLWSLPADAALSGVGISPVPCSWPVKPRRGTALPAWGELVSLLFQHPQRSAAVCTGASHSDNVSSSIIESVIEQPAMSREVT